MMGKTQKFSKGHSLGFVPDYRHVVETVGESEVFGSPARIDSEDSCVPKRKCISLNTENADKCDYFNVHREVFSLPRMSASERKELEMRFRAELEQMKVFQKKVFSKSVLGVNGVTVSAPGDMHVKKQEQVAQQNPKLNRGNSVQSAKGTPPPPPVASTNYATVMKQCETLLKRLMAHQYGWVFNTPVDVVKLNIPDYFQIIKHPMDLGTVKRKIVAGVYSIPWDFAADVRLTFANAMTYNPSGNDVHIMADTMSKFFETRWKSIEKKLSPPEGRPFQKEPPKKDVFKKEAEVKPVLQPKKRKISPLVHDTPVVQTTKQKMTDEQKFNLSQRLESSVGEMPDHIIDFLRRRTANESQASEDEIEIDIDALSDDTLFELEKLLDDYEREKQSRNPTKDERHEIEIPNESGLSNSLMHHGKGNELVDEDIDIGGNDLPVSTFPPVVIEKDTAHRSSKHGSSSSSSSDSGSSSSDSDSSSSSGSESDVKVSAPINEAKEKVRSGANLDQENGSLNGLSQLEQETDPIPVSVEEDFQREGESAPSERQVSPGKQYRAAVLRGRFADTILKAREKTLDQVAKRDPEKLRREREELERLQREEKARLQAEAKAAEDARKRAATEAAAEAAAEARRKRELEREAARKALQQMEKTVEINEGSLFLKDLEMLGTVTGEQIPSSVGETSPAHTPKGLGGFQLGSNPLERLGLYMKNDDDEEEEGVPGDAPTADVEEGEID